MSQKGSGRTLLFALLGGVTVLAGALVVLLFAQSTLNISPARRPHADEEMDAVRRRFGLEQPCLERPAGSGPEAPTAPGPRIAAVHMLAWSPGDRLVRATTPYWALRVGARKIRYMRAAVPVLDYVTVDDVERCGRGVLIDRTTGQGGRILIWAD